MSVPNFFKHATSELSQDAFLAWLFKWAEKENKIIDDKLQDCARKVLELFWESHPWKEITTIDIDKQWENIDLCITINKKYYLIIEDKTFTKAHDNQLERYYQTVLYWYKSERKPNFDKNVHFIYYKSGYITSEEEKYIMNESKFSTIDKSRLIEILKSYKGKNQILIDYCDYLCNNSKKQEEIYTNSYKVFLKNEENRKYFYDSIKSSLYKPHRYQNDSLEWFWAYSDYGEIFFRLEKLSLQIVLTPKYSSAMKRNECILAIKEKIKKNLGKETQFVEVLNNEINPQSEVVIFEYQKWLDDCLDTMEKLDRSKVIDKIQYFEKFIWIKVLGNEEE